MTDNDADPSAEFDALQKVIAALSPLGSEARSRIVNSASTFLQIDAGSTRPTTRASAPEAAPDRAPHGYPAFSEDTSQSPKDFVLEKQPRTDVERVAVLAYYLTHFREQPHFKTLDLSKLNTEAAQPKFSNASDASSNAVKRGYLVPSQKGQRQLSAAGEQFVAALPDHDAARAAMRAAMPRKLTRKPASKKPAGDNQNDS